MLNDLFGSEARVKVLNLLLLDPDKKFNLRQISKETDLSLASVKKEMYILKNCGLMRDNEDEWTLNQGFIIFPELRALIAKAQIISSQKFIDNLKKNSTPKFLALTGFFTGDALVKTDILIVGPLKRRIFLKMIAELEIDLGREINFTIMDETEFQYRQEIMDIFLYNILSGKTIVLIDELDAESKIKKVENKSEEHENSSFNLSGS